MYILRLQFHTVPEHDRQNIKKMSAVFGICTRADFLRGGGDIQGNRFFITPLTKLEVRTKLWGENREDALVMEEAVKGWQRDKRIKDFLVIGG